MKFKLINKQYYQPILFITFIKLMNIITEVKPHLYLGAAKHIETNSDEFNKLDINIIINCCEEIIWEEDDRFIINHYPINDDALGNKFAECMDECADLIDKYLSEGLNVYIHCVHGVSRSAAMVIYYLMKYEKLSYDVAHYKLFLKRPCIRPHCNFICELKKKDSHKSKKKGGFTGF